MASAEEQRTCVYGLRSQTRCVQSLVGETENSLFLVGTLGLNSENTLHAIAHSDVDLNSGENSNWVSVLVYKHPQEIHHISSSYAVESKNIFSTSYNVIGEKSFKMRSTCWKLNLEQLDILRHKEGASNYVHPEQIDLEPLFHFDDSFSKLGVRNVLFDPCKSHTKTLAHDTQNIIIYSMTDSFSSAVPTTYPVPVKCMTWHPQNSHLVALSNTSGTYQYDLRTSSLNLLTSSSMTSIDYHPTHPYTIALGSQEGNLHILDSRYPTNAHLLSIHTHSICQIHYNRYHDPLILTSSSDHSVQVIKFTDTKEPTKQYHFDLHEDSVYSCAWSAADAWVFCSASYDGRVLIHTLPNEWKYQIIMED